MKIRAQYGSFIIRNNHRWVFILAIVLVCLVLSLQITLQPVISESTSVEPGEPPVAPTVSQTAQSTLVFLTDITKFYVPVVYQPDTYTVHPKSRLESLNFYQEHYLMESSPQINWTGAHATCDPGTTSAEFRSAILRRINYFRAMAGVPDKVVFSPSSLQKAQAAALIMSVNRALSHNPPNDWLCYSDLGASGAGSANLYLGVYGWNAITGYMQDPGEGNYAAGHRRWILYPQTQEMGTGDIPLTGSFPSANALVVFDNHMWEPRPATREEFVAWPPPGYVPYPVVFGRWSFSYADADFSGAIVSMTTDSSSIPVSQSPVVNGYGENTIVWIPAGMTHWNVWPKPSEDTRYIVNIQNVIISSEPHSFTYEVIIFDPE